MPHASQSQAILEAVDAAFDAQVAFTQKVVAAASFSCDEAGAQGLMRDEMTRRGYSVDTWSFRDADLAHLEAHSPAYKDFEETFNVVGTLDSQGGGRSLILNGHIDVVPVSELHRWTRDPFDPWIGEGKLYGRGSGDMKAGVVSNLFAVEAIRAAGLRPKGRLHLQSVVDEESSGNGTLACVARGYKADAALIPEPTSNVLLTAQIGILWFDFVVHGEPQHASGFQSRGVNAIEKAYELITRLKNEVEVACNLPQNRHPLYAGHPHPIRLNIGRIEGGDWHSSVPAFCRVSGRLGVYPGQDPREVMGMIQACLERATAEDEYLRSFPPALSFKGNRGTGYIPEGADGLAELLAAAHEEVRGEPLKRVAMPYGTDARVLGVHGIPALVYGPHCERAHGIDECVHLDSVRDLTKATALLVARWCGVETA